MLKKYRPDCRLAKKYEKDHEDDKEDDRSSEEEDEGYIYDMEVRKE